MSIILKEVADAETVIARIKGKKTEAELIEEQKKRKPKPEKEKDERHYMHSLDGGGSFVYTPPGTGIWPDESTLTYFHGNKKREKR